MTSPARTSEPAMGSASSAVLPIQQELYDGGVDIV